MVTIISRKYFNQFNNGLNLDQNLTDFTIFLLGAVTLKMKRITEIDIFWRSDADSNNLFTDDGGADTITRETGSWLDDGFTIGDDIRIKELTIGFLEDNFILNVTDLVLTVGISNLPGAFSSNIAIVFGKTKLLGMNYFSNFIENVAPVTYISKVDETSIKKWSVQFTITEYDAGTEKTATASGTNESWKISSDEVKIKNTQQPLSANEFHQKFQITEIFTITPFFDTIDNLENGIKPEYLINDLSLRHVAKFEGLPTLLNPIIIHTLDDDEQPFTFGNVGYYDEQFNGFTPVEFTLDSIVYSNPSNESKIVIDETTGITVKINSLNNLFSQSNTEFQINIIFLNEDIELSKNIDTNFAFDTLFAVADDGGNSGVNGILSNVKGNIVSNKLVITADIDYTPTQQSLIDEGKYIISVITNDHTLAIDQSKLVNVLCDLNSYIKNNDVPGLMGVTTNFFYEHPFDKGTQGTTDFQGWVEDGLLISADFFLDLSLGAVINSLNLKLVAFNSGTGNFFEIADVPFDFATTIISNGIQEIDIDSIRGFKLVENSQFNLVRIKKMAKIGDQQHYDLDVGIKLQWMDWINLPDADTVFFDDTKIENGLNRLISNYSAENGYEIVIFIDAEVSNGVLNTNYRFISPALRVYEYDTDDTGDPSTRWSGQVELFDQSNLNLQGNIHGNENTNIKITFTALTGTISEAVLYTIIRLEEFQQGGLMNIWELSSFRDSAEDNLLIPLAGQNKTIHTVFASSVEVECSIDFTKLNPQSTYKISGRLGTACNESTECAWTPQVSGTGKSLSSIFFADSNIGWVCGLFGTILKTTDGGETWAAQTSGTTTNLSSIFFIDSNTGGATGSNGTILKTTDGGTTWVAQVSGTGVGLSSIFFADSNTAWVCGNSSTILKTTDGGTTWAAQTAGTLFSLGLFSISFIDSNVGWICGFFGTILKTTDGGTTWAAQTAGTTTTLFSIFFTDSNIGWICGLNGTILKTTNGGATWAAQASGTTIELKSIFFTDSNNGGATGSNGIILKTTDGGTTWAAQTSGTGAGLSSIFFTDPNTGWVCGSTGTILKYVCSTTGCDILLPEILGGKLKEDGTQKLKEDGNIKILE